MSRPLSYAELDRLESKVAELASDKFVLEMCLTRALQIIKPVDRRTHDFILQVVEGDFPLKGNKLRVVGGSQS